MTFEEYEKQFGLDDLKPKPCPFCGHPVEKYDGDWHLLHKPDCFLKENWIVSLNIAEAWNERTQIGENK